MITDKEKKKRLAKLRKDLRGQYQKIATQFGVSLSTVSRVLSDEAPKTEENLQLLAYAKKLSESLKTKEVNHEKKAIKIIAA